MLLPRNTYINKNYVNKPHSPNYYCLNIKVNNISDLKFVTRNILLKPEEVRKLIDENKKLPSSFIFMGECINPKYNNFTKEVYNLPKVIWEKFGKLSQDLGLDPKSNNKINSIDATYYIHEVPYGIRMEMMIIYGIENDNRDIARQWNSVDAIAYNVFDGVGNKKITNDIIIPVLKTSKDCCIDDLYEELCYESFKVTNIATIFADICSDREKDKYIKVN